MAQQCPVSGSVALVHVELVRQQATGVPDLWEERERWEIQELSNYRTIV